MTQKPDIFWIMTDEHRVDGISAYSDKYCKTPHLDKLAASGVIFDNAYCQAPACVPSRLSMLSGQYAHSAGNVWFEDSPKENVYWVDRLRDEAGYFTANFGKEHHHRPTQSCFQVNELNWRTPGSRYFEEGLPSLLGEKYRDMEEELGVIHRYTNGHNLIIAGKNPLPAEKAEAAVLVDRGIEFIDHYHSEQPVLMRLSMLYPHTPVLPPAPYDTMYDPADMEFEEDGLKAIDPPEFEETLLHVIGGVRDMKREEILKARAHYYGLCSYVDDQVGRLLDHLEANWKRPYIVMFCADHGNMLGEFGIHEKFNFYQMSRQVPFILAGHGIPEGKRVSDLVELLDMAPTFVNMAGLSVREEDKYQGHDLMPLIKGEAEDWRDATFCEMTPMDPLNEPRNEAAKTICVTEIEGMLGHERERFRERSLSQVPGHEDDNIWRPLLQCMQTKRYVCMVRAIWAGHQGEDLMGGLYDLEKDPYQSKNVFNDPAYAEVRDGCVARIKAWHESTDNPKYDPARMRKK